MNKEEIILDVIPVYKNEMYPLEEEMWHFKNNSEAPREIKLEYMYMEIEKKFFDCETIIIIENGKVLEILKGDSDENTYR